METTSLDECLLDLQKFLFNARLASYASGKEPEIIDGVKKFTYKEDKYPDLLYCDSYVGSIHFSGQEIIFHNPGSPDNYRNNYNPIWSMVYDGYSFFLLKKFERQNLLHFLREALQQADANLIPSRGPQYLSSSDYVYKNFCKGNMLDFSAVEEIFATGKLGIFEVDKIYSCTYQGGWLHNLKIS